MPEVLIVVDAEGEPAGDLLPASALNQMASALKQAIASSPSVAHSPAPVTVRVIATNSLSETAAANAGLADDPIVCPLTLNLPASFSFPAQQIYRTCGDVLNLRQRVEQMGYATGAGGFWLPIALTGRGPLYAEVIGLAGEVSAPKPTNISPSLTYCLPVHLSDSWRQQLYELACNLLQALHAPPATYLMQFGFHEGLICFDRLWPFPAAPAVASLGIQVPDLFTCHWYCLAGKPLLDLTISQSSAYYPSFA